MPDEPLTEAMPRTGKGTQAETPSGNERPIPWEAAVDRFRTGGWFWLSTVRPDGAPHTMPCFAAWAGTTFFVASKPTKRKSRNLDAEPRCVLAHDAGDLHLVVEGQARRVRDGAGLQRATEAFASVYDWPTTVEGDMIDAPYGAPTSGGAPFNVYEIRPLKAFGFPTKDEFMPTRWRF
jgi:Pyridoxamine 5'-phosphate oxidase